MGKAGRWLRNLFLPGRKGRKAKDSAADADCQSVLSAPLPSHSHSQRAAPSTGREKRRWSFRRPGAATAGGAQGPLASSSSHCFSDVEVRVVLAQEQEQDHQQQQEEVAAAAVPETASTAGTVVTLPASGRMTAGGEVAAAVRIQSAFRSYLARKALCALRGMVRLQAMVRGQLVRRQANLTLRRMQALVHAQRRARAERLRLLEALDDDASRQQATATPRLPPSRRSPQHPRSRKPQEAAERGGGSEDNDVRIVEVDDGAPRAGARRSSSGCCLCSTSTTTPSRTAATKSDPCHKVSPTPSSALTDASARTLSVSGRLDDASFTSASEPMSTSVPSRRCNAWRAADGPPFFFLPSYMANTESSRAKARSQSAPRQRLSSASETALLLAAASPSPSCCDRPPSRGGGGGSARHRASLDPLDLPGGVPSSRRMEWCASRARPVVSSVPGSECGSSSTAGHRGSARTGHGHGMGDF